jgi:hypothetical protein
MVDCSSAREMSFGRTFRLENFSGNCAAVGMAQNAIPAVNIQLSRILIAIIDY